MPRYFNHRDRDFGHPRPVFGHVRAVFGHQPGQIAMMQRARIVICDRCHLFVLMIDRFALARRFGHHGRGGRRRSCCE
jgi:hypothetical protein